MPAASPARPAFQHRRLWRAPLEGRVTASHPVSPPSPAHRLSPTTRFPESQKRKALPTSNFCSIPASKVTSASLPRGLNAHPPAPLDPSGTAAKPRGERFPTGIHQPFPLPLRDLIPPARSPGSFSPSLSKPPPHYTRAHAHKHIHPYTRTPQACRVPSPPWAEPQPTQAGIYQHRLGKDLPQRPRRPLPSLAAGPCRHPPHQAKAPSSLSIHQRG